jgi:tRNA (mo5U34)-methyltransferase
VKARWGIELEGGEGFRAIAEVLGSRVEYVRGDALALVDTAERFDVILCFGILHRVENPLGLLRALGGLLAPGGRLLVETYGVAVDGRVADGRIEVHPPSEVYRGDDYVYWGFGSGGLIALAAHAGFSRVTIDATPTIDRHPRILGTFERPGG